MTVGIYGIFDSETDECLYVGQSKNIEERWKGHLKSLRSGKHIRKDFVDWFEAHDRKSDSMRFEILEECRNDDIVKNNAEILWFENLLPKFFGKRPGLNERWTHSEETKSKISAGQRNKLDRYICKNCTKSFSPIRLGSMYCSRLCAKTGTVIFDESVCSNIGNMYLYEDMSINQIASKLNLSYHSIRKTLLDSEIPLKSRGGSKTKA